MESAEYSLDELLCQSLLLFRQYRFYDAPECGEKAFRILEEAHVWMGRTQECVDMAKWGCVIECLAQKYYIEDDTDAILEEIDAALVAHWKRIEKIHAEVTTVYLWLGYYFLLRFRNRESRSHSRCKQIMSSLLCALVEIFRKVEKGGAPTEVLSHLSVDVWREIVCWMEQVHDSRLCEKQSSALLAQFYKRSGKAGCFALADSGVLLLLRGNYLCLVLSFLLPHFHPLPASLYSSALQVLWKQLKKVEATFASTAKIRRKVS